MDPLDVTVRTQLIRWSAIAAFALAHVSPAGAHHSAAMFDASRSLTLTGAVTAWQFTNPHAWLHVRVAGVNGAPDTEWSIEFGSPNSLFRMGMRAKSLVPGDKVSVTLAPLRDGTPGGQIRSLTMPDGKVMQIGTIQAGPAVEAAPAPQP